VEAVETAKTKKLVYLGLGDNMVKNATITHFVYLFFHPTAKLVTLSLLATSPHMHGKKFKPSAVQI
jgi:hypothetical protein